MLHHTITSSLHFEGVVGGHFPLTLHYMLHHATTSSLHFKGVVGGHFSKSGSGVFNKVGVMLAFLYALISALASVYNEKLLKSDKGTMHAANVQLYLYGMYVGAPYGPLH